MNNTELSGLCVLVTRPRHQAGQLAAAIEAAGGKVFEFPVIEIVARDADEVARDAARLPDPDIVIFVSRNAVDHGLPHAATSRAAIGAIGPATRAALEAAGCRVDVYPEARADSEHLLAEQKLKDVAGKTIRIVRGDRGRELLGDTLRERGARVDYLAVYERGAAVHDDSEIAGLESAFAAGEIHRAVVMSVDSLEKLLAVLPSSCRDKLRDTPLVTPSERVIQTATELLPGARLELAKGPGPRDLVEALAATVNMK